jgi:hypothetical protein
MKYKYSKDTFLQYSFTNYTFVDKSFSDVKQPTNATFGAMKRSKWEHQQQKLASEMFFITVLDKLNVVLFQVEAYALGIKCPLLVIKDSNSPYYMSEEIAERLIKIYIR